MQIGVNLSPPRAFGEQMFTNLMLQSGDNNNGGIQVVGQDKRWLDYAVSIPPELAGLVKQQGMGLSIDPSVGAVPSGVIYARKSDMGLLKAGQLFRTQQLNILRPVKCIRFMDWMDTNHNQTPFYTASIGDVSYAHGVPVPVMAMLCNITGSDAWINIPVAMADADAKALVALFRELLDPGLNLYVEFGNEVWNSGFWAMHYANDQGNVEWPGVTKPNPGQRWYGMRCAQISAAIADPGVRFVMGWQTMNPAMSKAVLLGFDEAGGVNANVYGLTFAAYVDGGIKGPKLVALSEANDITGAIDELMNDPVRGMPKMRTIYVQQAAIGAARGWAPVVYEGNISLIAKGIADPIVKAKAVAFVKTVTEDPRITPVHEANFEALKSAGVVLYNMFNTSGGPGEYGYWGLVPSLDHPEGNPGWQVARRWMALAAA